MGALEELALRNAAIAYARTLQPEETRLRVQTAREVLGLLEERNPLTDREVFQRDELDGAERLARLTLLHAGEKQIQSGCVRHDCPRDGDCPVHGKNRPGQCVPAGEQEKGSKEEKSPPRKPSALEKLRYICTMPRYVGYPNSPMAEDEDEYDESDMDDRGAYALTYGDLRHLLSMIEGIVE